MAEETLILRGINIDEIIDKYRRGEYSKLSGLKKTRPTHKVELTPQSRSSGGQVAVDSATFDRKTSSGEVYRIYTTNAALFEAVSKEKPLDLSGLKCHSCHGLLSDRLPSGAPYPAMLVTRYYKSQDEHIFHGEGMYCDSVCAERHRTELADSDSRGAHYRGAASAMRFYHKLITGEESIPQRPHWTLLREYGGPLGRTDDYYSPSAPFRSLQNVVILPTKIQYETRLVGSQGSTD